MTGTEKFNFKEMLVEAIQEANKKQVEAIQKATEEKSAEHEGLADILLEALADIRREQGRQGGVLQNVYDRMFVTNGEPSLTATARDHEKRLAALEEKPESIPEKSSEESPEKAPNRGRWIAIAGAVAGLITAFFAGLNELLSGLAKVITAALSAGPP